MAMPSGVHKYSVVGSLTFCTFNSSRPRCQTWRLSSACVLEVSTEYYCQYDSLCGTAVVDSGDDDSNDDDGLFDECGSVIWDCFFDEECEACLTSSSTSNTADDDDIEDLCPLSTSSCSGYADFYCCAIEETMDDGCEDNAKLLGYIGECVILLDLLVRGCEPIKSLSITLVVAVSYDDDYYICKLEHRIAPSTPSPPGSVMLLVPDINFSTPVTPPTVCYISLGIFYSDCMHTHLEGDDCGFDDSICDWEFSGAQNSCTHRPFAAAFAAASVASLVAATTVLF